MTFKEADLGGWRTECDNCKANMHVEYDYHDPVLRSKVKSALDSFSSKRLSYPLLFQIPMLLPIPQATLEQVLNALIGSRAPLPGSTELRKSKKYSNLFLKCEYQNPTGSFKDLGTLCEFSKAWELGLAKASKDRLDNPKANANEHSQSDELNFLHLASTGNMAVSTIYYARVLHIPLMLHISKRSVNAGKLERMKTLGLDSFNGVRSCVECDVKDGGYDVQQEHVREQFERANARKRMWIGDTTLRIEGCKTIGYEIFVQLGCKAPDNVIVPVGNGTLLCGIWKAFDELKRMDLTGKIPRIYGVVVPERLHKKVSALGVARPSDLTVVFKIIRDSNGALVSLDENLISEGLAKLKDDEGTNTEAAGALSYASYEGVVNNWAKANEISVALVTGS